jgi:hypothetical protein
VVALYLPSNLEIKKPITLHCAKQILTVWRVEGDVPPSQSNRNKKNSILKHYVIGYFTQFILQLESATVLG